MRELLKNAWLGWQDYTGGGKFAALLFAALLFLGITLGRVREEGGGAGGGAVSGKLTQLWLYTAVMAGVCVCPLTAVCLMLYQTRFYDYEWIWSLVPQTGVIAAGGAVFLGKMWEHYSLERGSKLFGIWAASAAVAAVIFCGGGMGQAPREGLETRGDRRAAIEALRLLETEAGALPGGICLWAPGEIMACARAYSGQIRLPYGRDMWDPALGAYSYDTYDDARQEMYRWMCEAQVEGLLKVTVEETTRDGDGAPCPGERELDGLQCMRSALDMGVNCILLPGNMREQDLEAIADCLPVTLKRLGGYYLLQAG